MSRNAQNGKTVILLGFGAHILPNDGTKAQNFLMKAKYGTSGITFELNNFGPLTHAELRLVQFQSIFEFQLLIFCPNSKFTA